MRPLTKSLWLALTLLLVVPFAPLAQASPAMEQAGVVVGRVTDIEGGQLLRYVPDEKDWVVTVKDTPFGLSDTLYADPDTKAEIDLPNLIRMRIAGDTQLQAISLGSTFTEVDVGSGEARFYNNSDTGKVKVTLPLGFVLAPAGTVVDVHVADQSTEVVPIRGNVDFVYASNNQTYPVSAGTTALVVDSQQVTSKAIQVEVAWNDWNLKRDELWSARAEAKGGSRTYLPANLRDDSYELDQNGRWDRVYYQGSYRHFWRPTQVAAGWAPYTMGRWTDYYGDYAWIPDEPFGYVTHHYGNWIWVDAASAWYWAPPVVSVGVSFGCADCWYPGRVAWIFSGADIGWFPLAPSEPYYCHRWWGRGSFVVRDVYVNRINVQLSHYRFARHAIIVNQHNLFGVRDYSTVRLASLNRGTLFRRFRATPLLDRRLVGKPGGLRQRFAFTNASPIRRPGAAALERIQRNEQIARTTVKSSPLGSAHGSLARTRRGKAPTSSQMTSLPGSANALHRTGTPNRHAATAFSEREPRNRAGGPATVSRHSKPRSGRSPAVRARTHENALTRQVNGEPGSTRRARATAGSRGPRHATLGQSRLERGAVRAFGRHQSPPRAIERASRPHFGAYRGAPPHNVAPRERASFFGRRERSAYRGFGGSAAPGRTFQIERGRSFGMSRQPVHSPPALGQQRRAASAHAGSCRPGGRC